MEEVVKKYAVFRSHIIAERKFVTMFESEETAHDLARDLAGQCSYILVHEEPYFYEVVPIYTVMKEKK